MRVPFLQDSTFTGLISTRDYKTSQEWSQAYSLIQSNSAIWSNDTRSLWGSISGTLSAQSDLWRYLSAETFSPSQLTAFLASNAITLCSIDVKGQILSANTNLFDIFILDGGNLKGADILIGTNDPYSLKLESNSTTRVTIFSSGLITLAGSISGLNNPTTSFNSGSATGNLSFAIGNGRAFGQRAFAAGNNTRATASNSVAFGSSSLASGTTSKASGTSTQATNTNANAEGSSTIASGQASHAEGTGTDATGNNSHAEGLNTQAVGAEAHTEGDGTYASGNDSHAEGRNTNATGNRSHAEGLDTTASGDNSHAEGDSCFAGATNAHAEGYFTRAEGNHSHAEGVRSIASGAQAHAEGRDTIASGPASHAQGNESRATGQTSFAAGQTVHAEGSSSIAMGVCAIAAHNDTFIWSGDPTVTIPVSTTCEGQFYINAPCGVYIAGDMTVTGTLNGTVAGGGGVASYSEYIGDSVNDSFTVIHNLSTISVQTQVFDASNNTLVYPLVQIDTLSSINVFFDFVPSPSAYKVLVFGAGLGSGSGGGGGGGGTGGGGDPAITTIVQTNSANWNTAYSNTTSYIPTSADFVYQTNYSKWIYGTYYAANNYGIDKWTYAELSGGEFTFELIGGTINNKPIPKSQTGTFVTVNSATIVYRDDGYGLQPANYVDFINGIFEQYSLYTRMSATSGINSVAPGYSDRFILRLNTAETFDLTFKETVIQNAGGMINPQYYRFYVEPPYRILDQISLFGYQGSDYVSVWNNYTP